MIFVKGSLPAKKSWRRFAIPTPLFSRNITKTRTTCWNLSDLIYWIFFGIFLECSRYLKFYLDKSVLPQLEAGYLPTTWWLKAVDHEFRRRAVGHNIQGATPVQHNQATPSGSFCLYLRISFARRSLVQWSCATVRRRLQR